MPSSFPLTQQPKQKNLNKMNNFFRTEKEYYVLFTVFIATLLFVILFCIKTYNRQKKLNKDELKKEVDHSLDKSSKAIIIKMILDFFS